MNHYDLALNDIIEHIKADKGIVQPWRNKAVARMEEATAFIRMGLETTYRTQPQGMTPEHLSTGYHSGSVQGTPVKPTEFKSCTCPEGGRRKDCPVHGWDAEISTGPKRCVCTPGMPPRKNCPVHGGNA